MYKYIPYEPFEVEALNTWVNTLAQQGWCMVQLDTDRAKFVRNEGPRVYYQVRYIRDNKEINGAFWWGDLYFYHARDPHKLPQADYARDTMDCVGELGKPNFVTLTGFAVLLCSLLEAFHLEYLAPKYLPATLLMAVALALREYETYFRRCIQGNRVYRRGGVLPGRPVGRHPLVPTAAFGVALLVALVTYFL